MVKRIGYLHDKLCTEKNIALADKNARIGKKVLESIYVNMIKIGSKKI